MSDITPCTCILEYSPHNDQHCLRRTKSWATLEAYADGVNECHEPVLANHW